jgi:hypothetical protein
MSKFKTFAGALTLVLLASCGGSAKKAAPTTSPVSIATTIGPTTAAPATVPKPTVAPTTVAPTTTTMSLKDLEKVVGAVDIEFWAAVDVCLASPASCDPTVLTAADSPLRARRIETTKAFVEKKWISRRNEGDPGFVIVESVVFNDKRTIATLQECLWDTGIAVQPNAGPNGEDIIVDESKLSAENTVTLVLSNGQWLLSDRREIARYEGVNKCAGR